MLELNNDFTKVIRIGKTLSGHLYCKINYKEGALSITGVEGPTLNGHCTGGCGRIVELKWEFHSYAPGWYPELVDKFRKIWIDWHLNNYQPGSPRQMAHLKANPVEGINYYEKCQESLRNAGLAPDQDYLYNGEPYTYGRAWLTVQVPQEVVEFLKGLPETDRSPPWV